MIVPLKQSIAGRGEQRHMRHFTRTSLNSKNELMKKSHRIISSHLISSWLTSFYLNWVRCDWSQPRRTGSLHRTRNRHVCELLYSIYFTSQYFIILQTIIQLAVATISTALTTALSTAWLYAHLVPM